MHINFIPETETEARTPRHPTPPETRALPPSLEIRQPPAPAAEDEALNLRELLRQLWQQKGKLLLCGALGLALGAGYAFGLAVPRYPGTATLTVDWAAKPDRAALKTQEVILGSRQLLGQVSNSLGLTADPEFNPALPATDPMMRLERLWAGSPIPGSPEAQQNAVIDALSTRLSIRNVDQSLAYEIAVTSRDPLTSARAANTIALFYAARLDPAATGIAPRQATLISPALLRPPSSPGAGLILLISALIGLGLGGSWALAKGPASPVFRTSAELRRALGRPVLGALPLLPGRSRAERLARLRLHPESAGAEAFREIRTSALLSDIDTPPQVMMITSSLPGEGRTTTTLGLALTLAAQNKSVLVIEGDLRKRAFAGYFKTGETVDLLEALRDPHRLQPGAFPQNILGADILSAGRLASPPGAFFTSEGFDSLLAQARSRYDAILIDAPATLDHAETRVLGQKSDAILYAVQAGKTPKAEISQGITLFEQAGLYLTGLILTQAKTKAA